MGCDIHYWIEKKNKKGQFRVIGTWEELTRDYELFTLLAGVRDKEVKQIEHSSWPPQGLSGTLTEEFEEKGGFYHNHTCITLREFLDFNFNQPYNNDNQMGHAELKTCEYCHSEYYAKENGIITYANRFDKLIKIIEYMKSEEPNPDNIRMIMAFDS